MSEFQRENRYIVFKVKDVEELPKTDKVALMLACDGIKSVRKARGKTPSLECLVIESDWPEYEIVWQMIEDRMKRSR